MDLNEKQKELFSSMGLEEASKEAVAASESMGLTHNFAVIAEKIETVNLMLVPAMSSTGMLAGEVKRMYDGKGEDAAAIEACMVEVVRSISTISHIMKIPMERIVETAYTVKK